MGNLIRKTLTTFLFIVLLLDIVFPSNILVFSTLSLTMLSYIELKPEQLKINYKLYFLIFLFLFFTVSLFQFYLINVDNISLDIFNATNFNLFLSLLTFIFLPFLYRRNKIIFETSIDNSLKIITGFFFIQLLVYYTTGNYIEILEYLRGEASRHTTYSSLKIALDATGYNFIRPTSIFNEPGTYSSVTSVLFILSWLKHKKLLRIHILFLSSLFISLSGFGIVLGLIFCAIIYLKKMNRSFFFSFKNFIIFIPILILIILFGNYYYELRFLNDLSGGQGGLAIRANSFEVFKNYIVDNIYFGLSSGFNKIDIFAIEDTSLLFSIVFYFGAYSIILIFTIFKFFKFKNKLIILLFIISLSKIPFDGFAIWFFIVSLPLIHFGNTNKKIHEN
ncbi:hypothetical protein N9F15_03510 [Flavobacteriaceae bacterium]|nr:hypothetical protein [Flavobacteriaceae bacterium]